MIRVAPSDSTDRYGCLFERGKSIERFLRLLQEKGYPEDIIRMCDDKLYECLAIAENRQSIDVFLKKLEDMRCKVLYSEPNPHNQKDVALQIHCFV